MSIGNLNAAPEEMKTGRHEQRRPESTVRVLRAGNEDITIGENSILEGSFDTQGAMFVDGAAVNADLRAAQLSIGSTGRVEGQATVLRAEIAGTFDGMLECAGEVILRSSSRIVGEIKCAKLVTHRGALISAQVRIVDDERSEDEQGVAALSAFSPATGGLLNRRKLRRVAPVGYGIFLGFGMMGIVSLLL